MEFTEKEGLVLCLLGENLTNEQIGRHLGVKKATIKTHVSNILRKLDVQVEGQRQIGLGRMGTNEQSQRMTPQPLSFPFTS